MTNTVQAIGGHSVDLGGPLTTGETVDFFGAFPATIQFTGTTHVTAPTSGTLATTSQIPALFGWVADLGFVNFGTIASGETVSVNWQLPLVTAADASIAINSGTIEVPTLAGITDITGGSNITLTTAGGTLEIAFTGTLGYPSLPPSADIVLTWTKSVANATSPPAFYRQTLDLGGRQPRPRLSNAAITVGPRAV